MCRSIFAHVVGKSGHLLKFYYLVIICYVSIDVGMIQEKYDQFYTIRELITRFCYVCTQLNGLLSAIMMGIRKTKRRFTRVKKLGKDRM